MRSNLCHHTKGQFLQKTNIIIVKATNWLLLHREKGVKGYKRNPHHYRTVKKVSRVSKERLVFTFKYRNQIFCKSSFSHSLEATAVATTTTNNNKRRKKEIKIKINLLLLSNITMMMGILLMQKTSITPFCW